MTEHVSSDVLTPEEKHLRKMVEAVNQAAPRNLPADAVICPCENEHRPVYPVRYAYSNLYGEKNTQAAQPPDIDVLLNTDSGRETRGFSARILRNGWVYIFEEGQFDTRPDKQGELLIFQHILTCSSNENENAQTAYETFIPHILYKGKDGQQSAQLVATEKQYPYLPLKKDVMKISTLFSEVPLSLYVLEKIKHNAHDCCQFMQEMNIIDYNNNPYCVKATYEHIDNLVEDYKSEDEQYKHYFDSLNFLGTNSAQLSEVPGLKQETDLLLGQLTETLDYEECASLIILHDPVGYLQDILRAYSLVTTLLAMYQTQYLHPCTIGRYIEQIEKQATESKDTEDGKKILEILAESINQSGWNKEWKDLRFILEELETRQKNLVELHTDFISNTAIRTKAGSSVQYFKHAFLIKERIQEKDFGSEDFFLEVTHYCSLYGRIMAPLHESVAGTRALDILLTTELSDKESLWNIVSEGVFEFLDKDEIKDFLEQQSEELLGKLGSSIEHFALVCRNHLGYAFTQGHKTLQEMGVRTQKFSQENTEFLAKKLLPRLLDFFDAEISLTDLNILSGQESHELIKSLREKNKIVKNAVNSSYRRFFDWENRFAKSPDSLVYLPKILRKGTTKGAALAKDVHSLANGISAGYQIIVSALEIHTLMQTSEYEKNDPMKRGVLNWYNLQLYTAILEAVSGAAKSIKLVNESLGSIRTPLLKKLTKNFKLSVSVEKKLSSDGLLKGIGTGASVLGFAVPMYEASLTYSIGNTKAAFGQVIEGIGTVIALKALDTLRGPKGWLKLAVGLGLYLTGYTMHKLYSWDHLETLLKNCFWGSGDKYKFWDINRGDDWNIAIEDQIESINKGGISQKNILIEQQEFLNLFFPASLQVIEKPHIPYVQYIFTLPNFVPGIRDIEYKMVKEFIGSVPSYHQPYNQRDIIFRGKSKYYPTENQFTKNFDEALRKELELAGDAKDTTVLNLKVNIGIDNTALAMSKIGYERQSYIPKLYWYYVVDLNENKIAPLRYKNWSGGIEGNNLTFGFIDGEAP
ncbi:TPA: toxin VasX [Morganella morganii]